MERKQRFSIKKLSIGVVSICIGFAFLTQGNSTVAAAENSVEVIISNTTGEKETIPTQPTETTTQEEITIDNTVEGQTDTEKSTSPEQAVPESTASLTDHLANTGDTTTTSSSTESSVNEVELPTETTALSSPESSSKIETIDASLKAEQPNTSEGITALRAATNTSPTTTVSGNDTAIQAIENGSLDQSKSIEELTTEEQQTLNNLILTNFETTADQVALQDFVKPKNQLSSSETTKYLVPLIKQVMADPQYSHLTRAEKVTEATKLALIEVNKNLYEDASIEALAPEAKKTFQQLLEYNNGQLLKDKNGLTVGTIKNNLSQLYRGVLYLQQQYSFESDLPETLVFAPHTIGKIQADQTSAYDRLLAYGGRITDKRSLALNLNQIQFNNRMIGQYTGTKSTAELVEKIAQSKGKDVNSYFTEQSQALIGTSPNISIFELLKTNKPEYILPVLSQGRGVYLAGTSNSLTIGLLDAYTDLYPELKNYSKERGVQQPTSTFFEKILTYQENWLTFLDSAKSADATIPFTLAVDTMKVYNEATKTHTWSPNEGESAHTAVVSFFSPMNLWENYVRSGVGLGGVAQGESLIRAYETRFMHSNLSGIALFTHEMTHTNDDARLFRGAGRRNGQGPEVYARGLFEVIDNTQNGVPGEYKPVFNLNTALTIADSPNRTQALTPQTSTEELANYTKNLVDLIAYLEAIEARVALKTLSEEELAIYFNKVVQVPRNLTSNTGTTNTGLPSTNDAFLPFGYLTAAPLTKPSSINDLVDQDAVSGRFIPRDSSPLILELSHNQYDHVPLLDSFYGVSDAPSGNNTVGDISFKRHAYEILAWKGWDAFIGYISNRYSSDTEAYKAILGNDYVDWASFKKAQYKRLENKEIVNHLWQTSQLETDLEEAIKSDLNELKNYRNSINSLLNSRAGVTQTDLNNIAIQTSIANKTKQVRKVKQDILLKALQHNELRDSVFLPDIIYVKNGGNGQGLTEDSPMGSLAEALQKATDGTIIKLVGNATERTPIVIDKAITIESVQPENAIIFNESIKISNNVTLRNLSIHALTESNAPGNIYIDGQVTMDNVSTLISNRQSDKRPSLIVGSSADATDKRESSLKILNTNETVFDKMTVQNAADIAIANGTQIKNGVEVTTPSPVVITSESNQVNKFQAPETNQVTLIFNNSKASNVELKNISNLIVKNNSFISLNSQSLNPIQQALTVETGSQINLGDLEARFQSLKGDGILGFTDKGQLALQDLDGQATIQFKRKDMNFSESDGKTFVTIASKQSGLSVKLIPLDEILKMDKDGNYIYHQPYSAGYYFESVELDKILPSEVEDLLPEDKESPNQAIPQPEAITEIVVDGDGRWVFDRWELDSESTAKQHFYTGYWRYESSPQTTVRFEDVPFTTIYQADENRTAGEKETISSGKLGKAKITETEGSEPVREVLEKPQNEIVAVGTKPVVVSNILKYKTTTVEDPELPKGHTETVTQGKEGKEIITTTYTMDTKTGNITANTVTETIEPVEKVVKIGTKSSPQTTVRFEEIPFTVIYQADENRTAGEKETISSGKLGKAKIIETEGSEPVREVLEKPQNEIVAVGTKPVVVTNILKYKTTTVEDPELPKGHTETVTQGKEGKEIITTTYTLDTATGLITSSTKTERVDPVDEVVSVGTKIIPQTTVRYEEVPFAVDYQADENKVAGETTVIFSGKLGKVKITETEGAEPIREIVEKPQNKIVSVGTMTEVTNTILAFKTVKLDDDQLPKGQTKVVKKGKDGRETTTTTYTLDTATGLITSSTKTERVEPVDEVVSVGILETKVADTAPEQVIKPELKWTTTIVPIPFQTRYIVDNQLNLGEEIILVPGRNGQRQVITLVNGSVVGRNDEEIISDIVLLDPIEQIIKIGNRSTDKAIDLPSKKEKTDISNLGLALPNNKVSSTPIKLAETPKSIQYLTDRKYDSTVSPSQLQQTNGVILPKTGEQKENFLARLGYISLLSLEFCWAISTLLKNKRKSK
ncbi:YSIRK-type signal peptide-containing protein [Streptococcus suis]|nr:YSIRK-type signal peptide-containing protein [Streptococcus suis]